MAKSTTSPISDIEECKIKLKALLAEYNCTLRDFEEGSWVLLIDLDTDESINAIN